MIVSISAHILVCILLLIGAKHIISTGLPLPVFAEKTKQNIDKNYPSIALFASSILAGVSSWKQEIQYSYVVDPLEWQGVGANVANSSNENVLEQAHEIDVILVNNLSKTIKVNSVERLIIALKNVQAGQIIEIAPGTYHVTKARLNLANDGKKSQPIKVVAKTLGEVVLKLKGEGIVVDKPFWQFENLHLIGHCTRHSSCEHAFHVVGRGSHLLLRNNIFQDFNAAIKVNGLGRSYPDYGLVQRNTFYNTSPRQTNNPVTPFDLMHANYWTVTENFIFDFVKGQGNKVSYGAFFKGGSQHGVFSNNLVMCNANLHEKSIAIGLSLGGGGSAERRHRDGNIFEHANGVIRNNIVMNCANDVGFYLNKAENSLITNNILYNTMGIDIRFKESTAAIFNNILSGRIKFRDGGEVIDRSDNLVLNRSLLRAAEPLDNLFYAPSNGDFTWREGTSRKGKETFQNIEVDFCGNSNETPYLGAFHGITFCKSKLNLNNNSRQFKFTNTELYNES